MEGKPIYIYIWKWHLTLRHLTLRKINNFLFLKLINYTWHLLPSYPVNLTEELFFRIYRYIGLKMCAFKFYRYSEEVCFFKFYKHIGLKMYYFSYKYQFVIDKNQLENNFLLSLFFIYKLLFMFIENKIEILKKLIKIIIYKFKTLLDLKDILL